MIQAQQSLLEPIISLADITNYRDMCIPYEDVTYIEKINRLLIPSNNNSSPIVVDLFAGCGGLSLGFESSGFKTIGYEMEQSCFETYNNNLNGHCIKEYITSETVLEKANVIIGGPPCQPFSVGGNQHGEEDSRNGFPAFISAIERYKPDLWMFENVRGVFYKNKSYIQSVIHRLQQCGYIIELKLLNAVNYGVPQNRERIFVCGHKGCFTFPDPFTYKLPAGVAIFDTATKTPAQSKYLTENQNKYIERYEAKSKCVRPRDLHLDIPARTLTCRNLAGATSDMHRIKLPNGKRRRILVSEARRLQSFPDWYKFSGPETRQFYQIGNAVPPLMSYYIAKNVMLYLKDSFRYTTEEIEQLNLCRKIIL